MAKNQNTANSNSKTINWKIPEYEKHKRSKKWYIIALSSSFLLLIYSFLSSNFLFAVIIVVASIIITLNDGQNPKNVNFLITNEGLKIGRKFYDFDKIKNFTIIYKPKKNIKNLYFEFKNTISPRISIPLKDKNPLKIRKYLLKYLSEDLEKTEEPLSENLAKFFKL